MTACPCEPRRIRETPSPAIATHRNSTKIDRNLVDTHVVDNLVDKLVEIDTSRASAVVVDCKRVLVADRILNAEYSIAVAKIDFVADAIRESTAAGRMTAAAIDRHASVGAIQQQRCRAQFDRLFLLVLSVRWPYACSSSNK